MNQGTDWDVVGLWIAVALVGISFVLMGIELVREVNAA